MSDNIEHPGIKKVMEQTDAKKGWKKLATFQMRLEL